MFTLPMPSRPPQPEPLLLLPPPEPISTLGPTSGIPMPPAPTTPDRPQDAAGPSLTSESTPRQGRPQDAGGTSTTPTPSCSPDPTAPASGFQGHGQAVRPRRSINISSPEIQQSNVAGMTPGPQTDVELFTNLILLGYEDSAAQQITNSAIADGQVADTNMGTEKRAGKKVSGEVTGPEPSRDDFPAGLMGDLAYGQALSAWRRAHSRTIGPIPRAEPVDLSPQMEESQRIDTEANRLLQTITLENFDEVRAQLPDVLYVAGEEVNTDQYLSRFRLLLRDSLWCQRNAIS